MRRSRTSQDMPAYSLCGPSASMSGMQTGLYERDWQEYSKRTCANEIGLSLLAILIALISLKPMIPGIAALLPIACLIVLAKTIRSERMFHCPRCRASWNGAALAVAPSRSDCEHCGLAKWEGFSRTGLLRHRRLIASMRLGSALVLGTAGVLNLMSNQPLGWPDVLLASGYFTLAFFGPDGRWQDRDSVARAPSR